MKNIQFIICFIFLISFYSCDDFLDYKENDKMIPKTIENFSEFLYGEVIIDDTKFIKPLILMSDDVGEIVKKFSSYDTRAEWKSYYIWKKNIEEDIKGVIKESNAWATLYHKILICNVIINEINNLQDSERLIEEKYILEAEALFLRADAYFRLLNIYGEPFLSAEQAKHGLGIPINNEIGVAEKLFIRSSIQEVYDKIEDDLLKSIDLFKNNKREFATIFRPNLDAAYLLLSRAYLYQKKYKETIDICNQLINSSAKTIYNLKNHDENCLLIKTNTGILFTYEDLEYPSFNSSGSTNYGASNDLLSLLASNDLRKTAYFSKTLPTKPAKYNSDSNLKGKAFRIEEAYLNRAEALLDVDYKKAIKDINEIRRFKFTENYVINANSKEEAQELVRNERRIELSFEFHRWFDLRRYGMPEIRHTFSESEGVSKTYILEEGSPSYTLPIPDHILRINPYIKNINRPEIKFE